MSRPQDSFFETSWPKDRVPPTEEEWAAAEARHAAYNAPFIAKGDCSDGALSLSYMVATYAPFVWWKFFWPNEGEAMWKAAMDGLYGNLRDAMMNRTGP